MATEFDLAPAIAYIQTLWKSIADIRNAPDAPTEQIGVFPTAFTWEVDDDLDLKEPYSSNFAIVTAKLRSELHLARGQGLDRAVRATMTYRNPFLRLLQAHPTLDGNVMNVEHVHVTMGPLGWGMGQNAAESFGYRFDIDVRLELEA